MPLRQAIKLPIDVANRTKICGKGKIVIDANHISRAMVAIGFQGSDLFPKSHTTIILEGKLIITGKDTRIGTGTTKKNMSNRYL